MSHWKDKFTALSSNAVDFAQRITSELTAENEIDPTTELQYHKDQAIKFERDLVKCQSDLAEKNKEIETLSDSVREAFEEVEVTRQTLLNRLAAKELELEKATHQIEQLRDFQNESTNDDDNQDSDQLALELDIVRAEKASLSDELTALNNKLQYYQAQLAVKSEPVVVESNQLEPQELDLLRDELTKSNNRVESLRQEMSNLLERNHHLLNECTERKEVCQELEHKLTAIQTKNVAAHSFEIEKLTTQISQLQEENVQIHSELSKTMATNDKLINQLKKNSNYEEEVVKLDFEISRLLSLMQNSANLLEFVDQLKDENSKLSNQLATSNVENDQSKLMEQLKTENSKLSNQLAEKIQNDQSNLVEQLKNENSKLLSQLSESKNEQNELKLDEILGEFLSTIGVDFELRSGDNDEILYLLEREFNQLKSKIDEKDQKINEFDEKLQEAVQQQAVMKGLSDTNIQFDNTLNEELLKARARIEELETEIEEKQASIQHYEDAMKAGGSYVEELKSSIEGLRLKAKSLEDENSNSIQQIQSLEGENGQLKQNLKEENSQLKKALDENSNSNQQIQNLEEENEQLKEALNENSNEKIQALEEENEQLKEALNENSNERIQALEEENEQFKEAFAESEQNLTEVMENRKKFDKGLFEELSTAKSHINELETENVKSRKIVQQLRDEKAIDKTLIEELNMSIVSIRDQSNNESQNTQAQQAEIADLKEKLAKSEANLKELSENAVGMNSEELEVSKHRIQELENEIASNRELIREASADKRDKDSELDELKLKITQLTREIESLRFENNKCVQNIHSLESENDRMKTALIESESSLNDVMTERKNLEEGTAEAEIYKRYTQDKIERKQQDLDDATAKIQQKENEIDYYRTNLEKQQLENDQLHKRINGINSTIKDLQATYAESQSHLRAAERSLSQRDVELKTLIQSLQDEKYSIEQKNADADEKLKSALAQIEDLRAEIELLEERVQSDSSQKHSPANQSTSNAIAAYSIPSELRQFIVSAITCEEQQRADGALLLASLIDCTPEERQKVEQSYKVKPAGWTSIFRSQQPNTSQRPQNTREFLTQFVDFLERESATATAANIESSPPIRLDRELQPHNLSSDKDLNSIINQ